MIKDKWLKLTGELLKVASYEFSDHICNDWNFPEDWSNEEKIEFVKAMYEDNGNPEDFDPNHLHVPDWLVMSFLGSKLKSLM